MENVMPEKSVTAKQISNYDLITWLKGYFSKESPDYEKAQEICFRLHRAERVDESIGRVLHEIISYAKN